MIVWRRFIRAAAHSLIFAAVMGIAAVAVVALFSWLVIAMAIGMPVMCVLLLLALAGGYWPPEPWKSEQDKKGAARAVTGEPHG